MSKTYEKWDSAELSAWIRGHQNAGVKVVIVQMDLTPYKYGNVDPTSLGDAIFRRDGNNFTKLRNRIPDIEPQAKKRPRLDD